jgi:hypothetical protein
MGGLPTFSNYTGKELIIPNVLVDSLLPYKDGSDLHFVGTYVDMLLGSEIQTVNIKVKF